MTTHNKTSNTQRLSAFIFSSLFFLFFSVAIVPKMIGEFTGDGGEDLFTGNWEGQVMAWTYIVFAVGFVLSWFKNKLAAIIMLLAAILQMGPFIIIENNFGSLIFGLPLLILAILLWVMPAKK